MMATGFNASRAMATSSELSQYRIVHFATHGLLNDQHPGLSGVVLSLVDEQGRPQDGFLRLNDIYNLNLPADLIVLSACNTGLGKEIRGEGLVGIVRGFIYAGAARVVASLWKVDDEATAELMKRFYLHMLQKNLPAAAALRAAQMEMWQHKQWRSPTTGPPYASRRSGNEASLGPLEKYTPRTRLTGSDTIPTSTPQTWRAQFSHEKKTGASPRKLSDQLLSWLNLDRGGAGRKYEEIRLRRSRSLHVPGLHDRLKTLG
jgi:hypothetical protein